jgi:transforming growth factor-beta-induced protein
MKNSFKLLAAGAAAAALMVAPSAVSAQDEEPSIAEIAVGADDFDTLVAAADAAGLVGLLSDCSAGPFTVFAPTDAAFGALPQDVLDAALADPDGLLTTVLTYHVVPGTVLAADVVGLSSATTVQGEDIAVNGTVLNGSVNIVTTDLVACNGVVHVIDAVLLPPSLTADAPVEEAPSEELPATGVNNLTAGLAAAALLAGGLALIGVSRRRITV